MRSIPASLWFSTPSSLLERSAFVASEPNSSRSQRAGSRLETDTTDRDRYGRLLRYVYVGDTFVNEVLVRDGLAIARRYPPDVARADALASAQAQADAEAAGRGIWNHRALADAAGLELSALPADPPGVDNDDLNGEWVELTNTGHSTIDLTGWGLKDESASHRYGFPDRFELPAGAACAWPADVAPTGRTTCTGACPTRRCGTTPETQPSSSTQTATSSTRIATTPPGAAAEGQVNIGRFFWAAQVRGKRASNGAPPAINTA